MINLEVDINYTDDEDDKCKHKARRNLYGCGDPGIQWELGRRIQFTMGVITKFIRCYKLYENWINNYMCSLPND